MVDMCASPSAPDCPAHSQCVMDRPGLTSCQCLPGYVRIDNGCYGNVMEASIVVLEHVIACVTYVT